MHAYLLFLPKVTFSFPDIIFSLTNTKLSKINFSVVFHSYVCEIIKFLAIREISVG